MSKELDLGFGFCVEIDQKRGEEEGHGLCFVLMRTSPQGAARSFVISQTLTQICLISPSIQFIDKQGPQFTNSPPQTLILFKVSHKP